MNRALKDNSKVKLTYYELKKITSAFEKNIPAKAFSEEVSLNVKTINRYYREIRGSIIKSEIAMYASSIEHFKPLLRLEYIYVSSDGVEESMEFYLYVVMGSDVFIQKKPADKSYDVKNFMIKEDCYRDKYITSLKQELGHIGVSYLLSLCRRLTNYTRLYPTTIYHHLVEIAFRMNVKSSGSTLDYQYMKSIYQQFPLFKK